MVTANITLITTSYTIKRYEDIVELLESVQKQTYSNLEAIVVVDYSVELFNQLKTVNEHMTKVPVRIIKTDAPLPLGAAEGRNIGIRAASGRIVAFVDDDVVLTATWAEEIDRILSERGDAIGVTGAISPLWQSDGQEWVPKELYWLFSCTDCLGLDEVTEVRHAWGANMAFRKEAFDICGEFDRMTGPLGGGDIGIAEDLEFSLRAKGRTGKSILFDPRMQVFHKVPRQRISWRFMSERSFVIGYTRRTMKRVGLAEKQRNLLSREKSLLTRILSHLIPNFITQLPRSPTKALKGFAATILVLASAAVGYLYSYRSTSSGPLLHSRIGVR